MNIYIYIAIYLLGYIFAVIQDRKNDLLLSDEKRTNEDLMISLVISLLSWFWFFVCIFFFIKESKMAKFKYWLKQESKF